MRLSQQAIISAAGILLAGFIALVHDNWKASRRDGLLAAQQFLKLAHARDYDGIRASRLANDSSIKQLKELERIHGKIVRYRGAGFGCQLGGIPWYANIVVWREKGAFIECASGSRRSVLNYGQLSDQPVGETRIQQEMAGFSFKP